MTTEADSAYANAGVNYKPIDAFKRKCQAKAKLTDANARRRGVEPLEWSRGETAAVKRLPDGNPPGHGQRGRRHQTPGNRRIFPIDRLRPLRRRRLGRGRGHSQ